MSSSEGSALETLAWAARRYAPRIAFATGFGREGCVLVHLIASAGLPIPVLTLDTGLLFPETMALWSVLEKTYGVTIRSVAPDQTVDEQADAYGERLWARDPDLCCGLRKVAPLRRELAGLDAWVTAIRREQTPDRSTAQAVEDDGRFGLVKINPLVDWTAEDVDRFVAEHRVPVSALHAQGYPTFGCWPCTSRVAPGEDPRAGRWRGRAKTECGLHRRPHTPTQAVERNEQHHV